DRVLGVLLLLLTLPILLIVVLAVLVSTGRPVFYSHDRVGLNGKQFRLHKVRTMTADRRVEQKQFDGDERRVCHKSRMDPRVGPVGSFLRKYRLDELPQFLNVVKGDMSMVGPRPELPKIVKGYEPWQHQ